ncbi:ribonuclease D [Ferruginivarius sediminum]|uniref:Ribonuclease D n=1 Tax=Ferruginivarius sediminum TaxID=2661937 RepID=A0A369TC29_9PROT|nr:ribonuclease D [Ferruginivarius sediminum]RDD62901.1 ribonuclease D [Ferruginivarius sediminum]
MTLITDNDSLATFCARQSEAPYVAVDTEFLRDSTYWPKLCLIQLGGPDEVAAVDALAEGIDLTPVLRLLADTGIVKVFHSARQDMEIFHQQMDGALPAPIFDTQVAAMVCGFGEQVGYDTLARKVTGARIDKSSRFADWSQRPLTERQLDYALADVTHLREIYRTLRKQLDESGRAAWLDEEMAQLTNPATYDMDPETAWRRLKPRSSDRKYLAVLREMAAWREREAQRRDVPRNRVLRDEQIQDIAAHTPRTPQQLARTRGLSGDFARGRVGTGVLEAVERALALPRDERPLPPRKPDMPNGLGPTVELLKVLLKARCEANGVAQKLVATSADLEQIAADDSADVPALHGWRYEIFGADALALKRGQIALAADSGAVRIISLMTPEAKQAASS